MVDPLPHLIPPPPELTPIETDLMERTMVCVNVCPELGITKTLLCADRVICGECGADMLPVAGPHLP